MFPAPGYNLQYLLWTVGNIVWLFQHLLTPCIWMVTSTLWCLTGFSWKAVITHSHFDPLTGKQMLLFVQKTIANVYTTRGREECLHLLSSPTKFLKGSEELPTWLLGFSDLGFILCFSYFLCNCTSTLSFIDRLILCLKWVSKHLCHLGMIVGVLVRSLELPLTLC